MGNSREIRFDVEVSLSPWSRNIRMRSAILPPDVMGLSGSSNSASLREVKKTKQSERTESRTAACLPLLVVDPAGHDPRSAQLSTLLSGTTLIDNSPE